MTKTKKFFTSSGQNYNLEISGAGQPIFLLHGFSESLETWSELELHGWQCFKIDLIGHGKSDKPESPLPYQLPSILTALHELIEHYRQGQSFALLGYSMGGRVALNYALQFPENMARLILESVSAGISVKSDREQRRAADAQLAEQILEKGSAWFADFWGNQAIFSSQKKLPQATQQKIWQSRAENSPWALALTLQATGQGSLPYLGEKILELKMPLLYLSGALDTKYSQLAQEIFEPMENAKHLTVPHCGHNIHLENPQLFSEILQKELEN